MMRTRDAIGEGLRNASSGGLRALALAAFAFAVLGGAAVLDGTELQELRTIEADQWRAGGSTIVLQAEHGIDGRSCSLTARSPTILAAGSVSRTDTTIRLKSRPGSPLTVIESDWGAIRVSQAIGATPAAVSVGPADLLIGKTSMASLGLSPQSLHTIIDGVNQDQTARIVGATDLSVAGQAFTGTVIVVPSTQGFDVCIVQARPGLSDQARRSAASLVMADRAGDPIEIMAATADSDRDLVHEHRTRASRWAWTAAGLVLATAWLVVEASRRPERGMYLALGVTRSQLGLIRTSEVTLLTILAAAAAAPTALAVQIHWGVDADLALSATLLPTLGAVAIVVVLAAAGAVATRSSNVLAMVKDRG